MFDITEIIASPPHIRILDIGALMPHGELPRYENLVLSGLASLTGVEPFGWACEELREHYKGLCESQFFTSVVGDGDKKQFNVCSLPSRSSFFKPNGYLEQHFNGFKEQQAVVQQVEVESDTLDDLFPNERFDLVKLDVQGAELECIDYGKNVVSAGLVVEVEVEFIEQYERQPLFSDIDAAMRRLGFTFHAFFDYGTASAKTGIHSLNPNKPAAFCKQWIWSDALYLKNLSTLNDPDALLKIAVILHQSYSSFDTACSFIREYDKIKGTNFAPAYTERIWRCMDQ